MPTSFAQAKSRVRRLCALPRHCFLDLTKLRPLHKSIQCEIAQEDEFSDIEDELCDIDAKKDNTMAIESHSIPIFSMEEFTSPLFESLND